MSSDALGGAAGGRLVGRAVEFVGQVLIPAGVLTAVLYYFGYVRERALFSYFGVDLGTLEFTTTDYLVRSAGSVFAPLATIFVVGVIALVAHHGVVALLIGSPASRWRTAWITLACVAGGLLVIGTIGLHIPFVVVDPLAASLALGAGALLLEYAIWIAGHSPGRRARVLAIVERTKWPRRATLTGLAVVAAFWCTANLAHQNGLRAATAIEVSLVTQAEAVVYTSQRMQIGGPGVEVTPLDAPDSAFAFQYSGLRILVHTGDTWFLLPAGWRHDNDARVVLLPDDSRGIRVDLRP